MSGRNSPSYCTLTIIAMQGHQKQRLKIMCLGTAQFCYVGYRVGRASALQAGVPTGNWRGQEESTIIMFMVFAEVLTV